MHYIDPTQTVCGKCGSSNWEGFYRPYGSSGIRCLSCKHEKLNQPVTVETLTGFSSGPPKQELF